MARCRELQDTPEVCVEVVVGSEGGVKISRSTQTGEENGHVQITAPLSQVQQRMEMFMQFKRQQVDLSNQLEFCQPGGGAEGEDTCARTAPILTQREGHPSHIATHRVHNVSGPTPLPLSPVDQLREDLRPPPSWNRKRPQLNSSSLVGIQERLNNLEQCTDIYGGGLAPRDVLQRIRNLELRVLQMEGQSPEYPRPKVAAKSPPKTQRVSPYSSTIPPLSAPAHVTLPKYRK